MDYRTQNKKVLDYLIKNEKGITSTKAFWRLGITRISARIYDLREKGYHIITYRDPNTFTKGYHGRYVLLNKKNWWE